MARKKSKKKSSKKAKTTKRKTKRATASSKRGATKRSKAKRKSGRKSVRKTVAPARADTSPPEETGGDTIDDAAWRPFRAISAAASLGGGRFFCGPRDCADHINS